jgi:hypothetical protein
MITIQSAATENKPRGARKATLTRKAAAELRLKIDRALQQDGGRLNPKTVEFLTSIRRQLAAQGPRLSKKQRDVTDEILLQASRGEPLVILESEAIADLESLIRHASGDGRVSSLGENIMANLKYRLHEPVIAISEKRWRIIEEIRQKMRFGLPGEPSPLDPDGLPDDQDPDGLPPDPYETEVHHAWEWRLLGIDADEN